MKESLLTARKKSVPNSLWLVILFLLSSISFLKAQDVLLGQYEFATGANQEKASLVTAGLTFSDIIIEPEGLTVDYIDNTLLASGWASSLATSNHPGPKMVQFAITKHDFLSEYNVFKIILRYKAAAGPHVIHAFYGSEINPVNLASRRTGQNAAEFKSTEMDEGRNSNGVLFPAILNDMPTYYAIAFSQPTEQEQITFDRIEVWGTATAAPSAVSVDVLSKVMNASFGNPVIFPVEVTGYAASQDVAVSIVGNNANLFSVDKSTLTTADLTAAVQTLNVTYHASEYTFNLEANAHYPHAAVLRLQSTEIPTIEIPIYASCHVLFEDFKAYDDVIPTNEPGVPTVVTDFPAISGNEISTSVAGWTGDFLYAYVTGKTLGSVNIASSASDSAYLITPEINLSQPYKLTFSFRSFNNHSDGRVFVYMDDLLIFSDVNTSNSIKTVSTDTYIGSANSKIKFTGLKNEYNQIIVDDIMVNYAGGVPVNGTGLLVIHEWSIKMHADGVEITGYQGKNVQVFSLTGIKISERMNMSDLEFIPLVQKGSYILNISDGNSRASRKIMVY